MTITMLVTAVGRCRMLLRRLLRGRVSALAISWPQIPPSPTAVFAPAHALPELDLLREAPSAAVHTAASCWFSAPPGLTLAVGLPPDYWRIEPLYRTGDIEKRPGPKRALPSQGRDALLRVLLSTSAQHKDVAVSEFENTCVSRRGTEAFVCHGFSDIQNTDLCSLQLFVTSLVGRWPCLCQFKPHPWIVWPVKWPGMRCMHGSFQSVSGSSSAKCGIRSRLTMNLFQQRMGTRLLRGTRKRNRFLLSLIFAKSCCCSC